MKNSESLVYVGLQLQENNPAYGGISILASQWRHGRNKSQFKKLKKSFFNVHKGISVTTVSEYLSIKIPL